jgi:hypothetical protein
MDKHLQISEEIQSVSYFYTVEEAKAIHKILNPIESNRSTKIIFVGFIISILRILWLSFHSKSFIFYDMFSVIYMSVVIYYVARSYFITENYWLQFTDKYSHFYVAICKDGFYYCYDRREYFTMWSHIINIEQKGNFIMLHSHSDCMVIPERAFTTPEEATLFYNQSVEFKHQSANQ